MAEKKTKIDPGLMSDLDALVSPISRGDPESPLQWIGKSTRKLANVLTQQGHQVSHSLVARLLRDMEYSLQANTKRNEGTKTSPDRDKQFAFIDKKTRLFQHHGQPVVSVDAKKKEKVGNYKNAGQEYRKRGHPRKVNEHDFPGALGRVTPYGVYDVTYNLGWVSVGVSADTAEFAVKSLWWWWQKMGRERYPSFKTLLITADCGGSNGYRVRLWKYELQQLANELGSPVHVSHYPPGTSKWNKIEHRMFSFISQNWRGQPLTDYTTIVSLIGSTTTEEGLSIQAMLDEKIYQKGRKVSADEFNHISIYKFAFHGEWNYKISPQK